ncbi:MAG: type II secretion system minor pseudopilin GspK [Thermodesulfobacteriota bacterium]
MHVASSVTGNQRGAVLLLVLLVVALLAALVTEFAFSALVDLRLAETYRDTSRAYYLARGGIRAGQAILNRDRNDYDGRDEPWGRQEAAFPVGDGEVTVTIEDRDGRLAINALVDNGNPQGMQKARFQRLFSLLGLPAPENLTAALIDWLDPDGEEYGQEGAQGAESGYYLGLTPPYQARNGPMKAIEELTLVRGFTAEVAAKLAPYLTLEGDMQVNINTAPAEVIASLYLDGGRPLQPEEGRAIAAACSLAPMRAAADLAGAFPELAPLLPTGAELAYRLKYTSDRYRIRALARVNDGSRVVTAVVRKSSNRILSLRVD